MRSSIACARCRRSKVKCVNSGIGTTCRACETTGRECTYPQPSASGGGGGGARRESGESRHVGDTTTANEAPKRHRPKKIPVPQGNVSTKESMRALVDALDPSLLTPQVWIELFEIWQLHFSTDLPFIHPPTFLKPLRQMQLAPSHQAQDFSSPLQAASLLPPASHLLLLGFLSLTARFHEKLVAHHSPPSASRPSNPLIASQYYAAACKARLAGNFGDGLGLPDVQRIQALCMLALHDWGNCQGIKSWTSMGVAMRYAQVLGLQYQPDFDDEPQSHTAVLALEAAQLGIGSSKFPRTPADMAEDLIEQETRRRIFWSCFIMDRYLSSGKYRPQMLRIEDMKLQLPSTERAFLFGERVRTGLLLEELQTLETKTYPSHSRHPSMHGGSNGESTSTPGSWPAKNDNRDDEDERLGRWETGNNEGVVSRYIKAIDLYGHVIKWSCGGGRRRERFPPWDPSSQFYVLQARVSNFIDRLPRDLALSQANTSAHIASRTCSPYALLHCILLLCRIMLHREYVPFVPLRCTKPQGPLEPPLFPSEQYSLPRDFWEESAKELFRSARSLMHLVQMCHEWNSLAETPMMGFSIYMVALVGVYAINFPWMDTEGQMCKKSEDNDAGVIAARQALAMIGMMRKRLKMADGWFRTISRVHKYYIKIKKDVRRNARALAESPNPRSQLGSLSLREGGYGGELEAFKMIESVLQEFGSLEDDDMEMPDAPDMGESSVTSTALKSEVYVLHERTPENGPARQDRWNAINNMPAAGHSLESTTNGSHGGHLAPSNTASPTTSNHPGQHHYATTTSPLVSPPSYQNQFPPYLPTQHKGSTQQASITLQQQMQHQPVPLPPPPAPMTVEETEAWLQSLETPFGGDDITAFVEGKDWQDWASASVGPLGVGGWLSTVWAGSSNT